MSAPNDLVLFHYPFSPYARRVVWYLTLRGIGYAQCLQPPILPREDLGALGLKYRRIPVLAIGADIYCDTRLILRKLEERFPGSRLSARSADEKAVQRLLERWTIDAGIFVRAAQLIPPDMPLLKDPRFLKDRTEFSGRSWSAEGQAKGRPEALVHIRDAFELLETTLLADGRDWVLKTDQPSLADIDAIWPFDWLVGLKGAIPPEVASAESFPKVFSWIARFNAALQSAKSSAPKPTTLKGSEALDHITSASFVDKSSTIDVNDPLKLKAGQIVEIFPIDSGFGGHKDRGRLMKLTPEEVAIEVPTTVTGKEVRVHLPRWNTRIHATSTKL